MLFNFPSATAGHDTLIFVCLLLHDPCQVVEALLDPATVQRIKAVRQFVEQPDGSFPPPPLASELPQPLYGEFSQPPGAPHAADHPTWQGGSLPAVQLPAALGIEDLSDNSAGC
jgi:hypothetical protein